LAGKLAVVVGASRGIGQGIALAYARKGASVVAVGRDIIALRATQALLKECGHTQGESDVQQHEVRQCDVRQLNEVEEFAKVVVSTRGVPHVLVNAAGINVDAVLPRIKMDVAHDILATNLIGTIMMCRAFVPEMMRKRTGSIVNVASVVGIHGHAGQSIYAASKAGVIGFTKSIAKELASRGITANVVAPGFVETNMTRELTKDQREHIRQRVGMQRFGTVQEIADAALFLATATYMTGQVVVLDGGLTF